MKVGIKGHMWWLWHVGCATQSYKDDYIKNYSLYISSKIEQFNLSES